MVVFLPFYPNVWVCESSVQSECTVDQKHQRIDASEECLALLNRNKMEFYRRYVTMDETWLHYYTPERNLSPNDEVIAETEAYFDEKEKSYI